MNYMNLSFEIGTIVSFKAMQKKEEKITEPIGISHHCVFFIFDLNENFVTYKFTEEGLLDFLKQGDNLLKQNNLSKFDQLRLNELRKQNLEEQSLKIKELKDGFVEIAANPDLVQNLKLTQKGLVLFNQKKQELLKNKEKQQQKINQEEQQQEQNSNNNNQIQQNSQQQQFQNSQQ